MAKYNGTKKGSNRSGGQRKNSEKNGIHGNSENHSQKEKGNQRRPIGNRKR